MFFDISSYPFLKDLEDNWQSILSEYEMVKNRTVPYLEFDLYLGEWKVFPFLFLGDEFRYNITSCPKTWKILSSLPCVTTAAFSVLKYSTNLEPHTGLSDEVLRCHLGLKIPPKCLLTVDNEDRIWEEGKCLIFDDMKEHSAYNHSMEDRVVLLLDFKKE